MSMENIANPPVDKQVVQQKDDDEINLMDLLLVIAKHNRLIFKLMVVAVILSALIAMSLPKKFTAKVTIMPPQQSQSSAASLMLGQLGGLGALAGGVGSKGASELYVTMLKSRFVANRLIKRFKLMEQYNLEYMETARSALSSNTDILINKDSSISLEFVDKDPIRAAEIANSYAEELNNLVLSIANKEALGRKLFYEKQLAEVKIALNKAELEMKVFQENNSVFGVGGGGSPFGAANGGIPKAQFEFAKLFREVKFQETMLAVMAQQVTTATLDAAKDTTSVQVLDSALTPELRSSPKRAMIVIFAVLLAFFVGIIWAFIKEAGERAGQNPEQTERMNLLKRYFLRGC